MIKYILIALFFCSCTKVQVIEKYINTDNTVTINHDTTIVNADVWDGQGKVLRITDAKISGNIILKNWIIDAALTQWVFDTAITLQNVKPYGDRFSTAWYGARSSNTDNWWNLQKSINTCLNNNIRYCYTPAGNYNYSRSLNIESIYNNQYAFCSLRFGGESSFWSTGNGTNLYYNATSGSALNLQLNKGSEVDHINLNGWWRSPGGSDSAYFNLSEANYKDVSGKNVSDYLSGISIDGKPPIDGVTRSGSTGNHLHDLTISNFTKLLSLSPNGITDNNDILMVENLHLGDGKYGICNGQAQEKDMRFYGVYAWGSLYNVISIGRFGKYQAGEYSFDGANIAGRVIQVFDINTANWFSTHVTNFFVESIARIGNINGSMPVSVSNSTFDLNHFINTDRIVLYAPSNRVQFSNSTIRYYNGGCTDVKIKGAVVFNNVNIGCGNLIRL